MGREINIFVLRYVPNILEDRFVNIGVLLTESDDAGFADSRFLRDWQQVRSFDPNADIEVLESLAREIEHAWKHPSQRAVLLRRMLTSFSGVLQLYPKDIFVTDDPAGELERLTSTLL